MSNALAKMIVGSSSAQAEDKLPGEVEELRRAFPANEMVSLIQRRNSKPSERVRLRKVVKELRAEGIAVSCPDHYDGSANLQVQAGYQQSGFAWRIVVRLRDPDSKDALAHLAKMQEALVEQALPMLAIQHFKKGMILELIENFDEEDRAWREAGLHERWEDVPLAEALLWGQVFGDDQWVAQDWRESGMDLDTAREWYANGEGFTWLDDVREWMSLEDITAEIAIQLTDAGLHPKQAHLVRNIWPANSGEKSARD